MKSPTKLLYHLVILSAAALFPSYSFGQENEAPKPPKPILPPVLEIGPPKKYTPAELVDKISRQYLTPKGGFGIVDIGFFTPLRSVDKNEILQPDGKYWTGREMDQKQVVYIFHKKLCESDKLPNDFELFESVLVSFEGPVVRFVDFRNLSGGFWSRASH